MLAYAIKPGTRGAEGIAFRSLDPGERQIVAGPISWIAAKSKYFIVGLLPDSGNQQFVEAQVTGGPRTSRTATHARGTVIARLDAEGGFRFDLYAGPQQYQRLVALGRDFENSNPYGGWMQGIVQPFATIVMKILLWMKASLGWSYGALLVLFGVAVRLLMWPLNQGAMRTTMKMQRVQPEVEKLRKRHEKDPQKLNQAVFALYKENKISPLGGCLPMLIQMPVMFALYQVFLHAIELRRSPFVLWIDDLSAPDVLFQVAGFPIRILPLIMFGSSMLQQKLTPTDPRQVTTMEGCLSVPDITESVDRPRAIHVRYADLDGTTEERQAAGLLARVVQHEIDHLKGILFVDRLSLVEKQLLRKKLRQLASTPRV